MKISLTIFSVVTLALLLCCFAGQTDAAAKPPKCKPTETLNAKTKKCVAKKAAAKPAPAAAAAATTAAAAAAETTAAPA